jgi:uncharacterized protein YecE (DUF72 family)
VIEHRLGLWQIAPLVELFVGQAGLLGQLNRYQQTFNLLEIGAEPNQVPKSTTLKKWRESVPSDFVFSVRLPAAVSRLERLDERALEEVCATVATLDASFCVMMTPPSVNPSARSKKLFEELLRQLSQRGVKRVVWEPHGVFERDEAEAWAEELGVLLAVDPTRDDPTPGPVVYARLRALGAGARVGAAAAERVAERIVEFSSAYVVVEGQGAERVARGLRETVGTLDLEGTEAETS